jgi:hypothetical protein
MDNNPNAYRKRVSNPGFFSRNKQEEPETSQTRIFIIESVDLRGFSFKVEAYKKFYHRHIVDIPRIKFFV